MTHKHTLTFWLVLLGIFLLIFLMGYVSLKSGTGIVNIMPPSAEAWSFMILSAIGVFKSFAEIVRRKHI
jgi:hypothetical protein